MEKRSECPSLTPSCSGSFAQGPSLAAGRGWGPAQSLPLSHLFGPEEMSPILRLSLFPPGDRAISQSHIHLSHHHAPKFTFPMYPFCLFPVSFCSVHKTEGALLALALLFTQILFSPVSVT